MGMNLLESSLRRYLARFERSDVVKKIQKLFSGVTIAGLPACQWVKLSVVAGMVIVPWAAFAAPANDDFANAISITDMVGSVSSTNNSATLESGEPDFINADDFASVDNSVWYQWTAPSNGVVAFDTFGSGFDTVLAVYTNSFSDPIVAGNDDYILGIIPQSYVTFAVQAGTTYYISVNGNPYPVAGYTDAGNFVLNWKETVPTIPSGTFQFTSAS
jgi:hypothetical protein